MSFVKWLLLGAIFLLCWWLSGKVADCLTPKILKWIKRRKEDSSND